MARPQTLIVIRTVLLGNALLLFVIGALVARFVDHPHPLVIAAVVWLLAAGLLVGVRWTDPYAKDL